MSNIQLIKPESLIAFEYNKCKKSNENKEKEQNEKNIKIKESEAIATGAKSLKTTIDETMAKPEVQETISKAKDYIEKSANTVADLFKSNKEDDHAE